jgi:hypothetical protein
MTTRERPAPRGSRHLPQHRANGYHHNSGDYRHQAPTADERREKKLLNELHALGYGITVPCLECGHPLTSATSLARHLGPVCAARAKAENVDG